MNKETRTEEDIDNASLKEKKKFSLHNIKTKTL